MRNEKRWIASLVALLLVIQCFGVIDLGPFQMQKVRADTIISPTQTTTATTSAITIPTNVNVALTDTTLTVSWDAVPEAQSYDISLDGNITNTTDPKYTYDDLQPNTQYIVKVRAVNPFGIYGLLGDVNNDEAVDAIDFAFIKVYLLTNNLPLTEITITDINGDGTIDAIDAALIKRKCLGAADVNGDGAIDAIDFALLKKKLLQGNSYNFPQNVSAWSSEITKYTLSDTEQISPTTPENIVSHALNDTEIIFYWDASTDDVGVTGYDIYIGTNLLASITGTQYIAKGLTPNTTYTFIIRAKDADGNESSDGTTTVTTEANITEFTFQSLSPAVTGDIFEAAYSQIRLDVPADTDVSQLVATFTANAAAVKVGTTEQISGITPNDFTNPVTYTVVAVDGSTQNYTIIVRKPEVLREVFVQVSAGGGHTVAVKEDSTVWAWGDNMEGQLGLGILFIPQRVTFTED